MLRVGKYLMFRPNDEREETGKAYGATSIEGIPAPQPSCLNLK